MKRVPTEKIGHQNSSTIQIQWFTCLVIQEKIIYRYKFIPIKMEGDFKVPEPKILTPLETTNIIDKR
jgi:hypothetical protein